jgi:hypothetical protein
LPRFPKAGKNTFAKSCSCALLRIQAVPWGILLRLRINDTSFEVHRLEQLRSRFSEVQRAQFAEVWLEADEDWPSICALINGDAAWLMYIRHEGDAGFSTRNLQDAGPAKAMIEYYLTNGQRDEYPASWNITTTEALRALEHFLEKETMAPWLTWQDDSVKPKR